MVLLPKIISWPIFITTLMSGNCTIAGTTYEQVVIELKEKLQELREKYNDSKELDQHFIQKYKDRGLISTCP